MFVPMATVDGSDDLNVLEQSDVIVVTAGAKQKPGQSRIELAEANTAICRQLIPALLRVTGTGAHGRAGGSSVGVRFLIARVPPFSSRKVPLWRCKPCMHTSLGNT